MGQEEGHSLKHTSHLGSWLNCAFPLRARSAVRRDAAGGRGWRGAWAWGPGDFLPGRFRWRPKSRMPALPRVLPAGGPQATLSSGAPQSP